MPVVLEKRVTREKLDELLAVETEDPQLDFKEDCDLAATRDRVEFTKDVGAMQAEGGFIVIGADSSGRPTGRLSSANARRFDEARLRDILGRYLAPPFDLAVGIHEIEGKSLVAIYVGPSDSGVGVFIADGQYEENGQLKRVFGPGDVFVRQGTQSRRWGPDDLRKLIRRLEARSKEKWRAEAFADFQALLRQGTTVETYARGAASALTWQLPDATFEEVVLEQVRRDDEIPVRRFLNRITGTASELLASDTPDDVLTLLDRLACLLALFIELRRPELMDQTLAALVRIYELTFDERGFDRDPVAIGAAAFRLEIVKRIVAVGGYAVREGDWPTVRKLVVQRPNGQYLDGRIYTNWVRHAQVGAARAGLLGSQASRSRETATLISEAAATATRLDCLCQDLPGSGSRETEAVVDSLVRFDFLGLLAVLAFAPGNRDVPYYPSFAPYYWERFEPVLRQLISDRAMRDAIYPGDDQALADDLDDTLRLARAETRGFGSRRIEGTAIKDFLSRHGHADW